MEISLGKTQKGKKNYRRIKHGGFLSIWHMFEKEDIETRDRELHFELYDKNVGQQNTNRKFLHNNEKVIKTNTL